MTPTTGTERRTSSASTRAVEDPAHRFSFDGFVTSEWESAAEWDVPAEWPPAEQVRRAEPAYDAERPLPEAFFAPVPRPAPKPPLPRRRDLRRGTAELPVVPSAPAELAVPLNEAVPQNEHAAEVIRMRREVGPQRFDTIVTPARGIPARDLQTGERPALPRRRDVHRPDRAAARQASVLAYRGGEPSHATTVRASGLPVAAARIGVVSVLVAVGAGVIGGERLDLIGSGGELTAAEGATALALAPLPNDPRQLTIWDSTRDQQGLEAAAQKVSDRLAAAAEKRRQARIKAERKAAAERAARKKREQQLNQAIANARSNPRAYARIAVANRGWSSSQFNCLDLLWQRESGWNYRAQNPSSGAYGIPQSLPGNKMGSVASDWRTNPITQITWGLNYIADRYGTPCGAWAHSERRGWY